MKIGDKVKILQGDHEFEGRTGLIRDEFEKEEGCEFDFEVDVNGDGTVYTGIPFYVSELEVIGE